MPRYYEEIVIVRKRIIRRTRKKPRPQPRPVVKALPPPYPPCDFPRLEGPYVRTRGMLEATYDLFFKRRE